MRLDKNYGEERQINVLFLQHLQEREKRKLYLERGFSSLFDYAVKELAITALLTEKSKP